MKTNKLILKCRNAVHIRRGIESWNGIFCHTPSDIFQILIQERRAAKKASGDGMLGGSSDNVNGDGSFCFDRWQFIMQRDTPAKGCRCTILTQFHPPPHGGERKISL